MLGDILYTSVAHPLKPSCTLYPSLLDKEFVRMAEEYLSEAIALSDFRNGPVNIEMRIDASGKQYIMEIGPRSGGSYTPQAIKHASGFDMLAATFDLFMGNHVGILNHFIKPTIVFTIHSNKDGTFVGLKNDPELDPFIIEEHLFVEPGDKVYSYHHHGSTLGVFIFRFDHMSQVGTLLPGFYERVLSGVKVD